MFQNDKRESIGHRTINGIIVFTLLLTIAVSLPDGVTEATDSEMRLFGEENLIAALNKNRDSSPDELLNKVKTSIDEFVGDAPQFDDITMLAFRYNGK